MSWRVSLRSQRARIVAAALATLLVAELAVLLLSPSQPGPEAEPVEAGRYFAPAQIERAEAYRGGQRLIATGLLVAELAVLGLLAWGRPASLQRGLARLESRPLLGAALAGAGISALVATVALPGGLWAHERAVDVGISTQDVWSWLYDRVRSIGIGAALAAVGALILVALQRRLARAWWLAGAAVAVAFATLITFVAPVVLAPIYNDFERLPAGQVRTELLELAARADVEVDDVYVVDASRRGTSLNAYVDGIGATRRIVVYDNLLEAAEARALRSVVAHELAHVKQRDVLRGILFVALVAPLAMLFVREAGGSLARRMGAGPGTVRALPAYAFALTLAVLGIGIAGNQLSRQVEERADRFALELTGDPGGLVTLQTTLAERNVSDPDPPGWAQLLFGTHPTKLERLGLAVAYRESAYRRGSLVGLRGLAPRRGGKIDQG
jgi:STE24 endopeptidase